MKYLTFAILVFQAALQITNAQVIRTSGPILGSCGNPIGPIISSFAGPIIAPPPCSGPIISCNAAPIIGPSPCSCGAPFISAPVVAAPSYVAPVVQSSVANSLADTLSLLTVSSLLAETLPFGPNVVGLPVPGCGCGLGGLGYGGYYY